MHPETVLLIDDHQSQGMVAHVLLKQRLGAHQQRQAAVSKLLQHLLPSLALDTTGQPAHVDTQGLQPLLEALHVLLSQQFRGRHQRHLETCFNSLQCGQSRHDSLAGPYITLHQAQHGDWLLHVC